MIIDSFDMESESKINPHLKENAPVVDACIITKWNVLRYRPCVISEN